ncbi:MAG: hypothetical protein ABSB70_03480 [Candidatus Velthaea sp.]
MRLKLRIPKFASSTVETAAPQQTVLDGSDVIVNNRWNLPPHTVAVVGRPAVWFSFDVRTPNVAIGPLRIPSLRLVWEQDFGGHLFVATTGADASRVTIVEAGPMHPNGSGALVPFAYPEDQFAERGVIDFEPIAIAPPNGLAAEFFAELVRTAQREYDGNQRYRAVEIPFLRVGRDSNSYAVGVLISCGIDPRDVPKPRKSMRFEWTGYPGMEDPVHRSNFGAYLGIPNRLADDVVDVAYHNADGSVRYAVVGGRPNATVQLPDGSEVRLDANGRITFAPDDARRHGLPTNHSEPPAQIRSRRKFPPDPSPAGAEITLIVDGRPVPLAPGAQYRGTVERRHDGLGLAHLRGTGSEVVLPLVELGAELRDPKRVDRLLQIGTEVTVGLSRDRHPKLRAHGTDWLRDRLRARRFHLPRTKNVAATAVAAVVIAAAGAFWLLRER